MVFAGGHPNIYSYKCFLILWTCDKLWVKKIYSMENDKPEFLAQTGDVPEQNNCPSALQGRQV